MSDMCTCLNLGDLLQTSSQRMEYDGTVLKTVMAMAEIAHGGQIIMDEASFGLIKPGLVQLHSWIAARPDIETLQNQCWCGLLPSALTM